MSHGRRRGIAAVEAAISLPMLIVLVVGSIEAANTIFLKQSMTIAAYEAAKIASSPQGTPAFANLRCSEVLASRGVNTFNLAINPSDLDATTPRGTQVTVTLTVTSDSAVVGPLNFFSGKTLQTQVDMVRL
ncbi:MAG: pilus assembly protein [Planctomycetaceae bacterium]